MNTTIFIYILTFMLSVFIMNIYDCYYLNTTIFKKIFFIFLIASPLVLLAASREDVGTDYESYRISFNYLGNYIKTGQSLLNYETTEPFMLLLRYVSYLIGNGNYRVFLTLSSILTTMPVILFILVDMWKGYKAFALYVYLFLFYLNSFNIIGQMIAISFIIYSFRYIFKKNFKKYLVVIFIASLFHNSAVIAIVFYFISDKITFKTSYTISQWLKILLIITVPILLIIIVNYGYKLPIVGGYFQYYASVQQISNRYFILLTTLPILPVLFQKKIIEQSEFGSIFYNIAVLSIPIIIISLFYDWAFRLLYYTTSSVIVTYPILIKSRKKNVGITKIILIISIILIFYFTYFVFQFNNVFEYKSILLD